MGRGRIQIPLLAGHQRPASETPFKLRFAGGPMVAQHWMLACKLCGFDSQNWLNCSAPLNRRATRAPDKKSFKRHLLLNHWSNFKIISQNCSSWYPLPKYCKHVFAPLNKMATKAPDRKYLQKASPPDFVCLFVWYDSLRPLNNLSVMRDGLPGLNQY